MKQDTVLVRKLISSLRYGAQATLTSRTRHHIEKSAEALAASLAQGECIYGQFLFAFVVNQEKWNTDIQRLKASTLGLVAAQILARTTSTDSKVRWFRSYVAAFWRLRVSVGILTITRWSTKRMGR